MRVAGKLVLAVLLATPPLWAVASSANAADISMACPSAVSGSTITLTADCDTTTTLEIPQGFTLDGAGHTITAHDPSGGTFPGPVLTNAANATEMSLKNLTVRGTGFAPVPCINLIGVLFSNASGAMTNVKVLDITQHTSCSTGLGVRVTALPAGGHQTITITGCTIAGFQKNGLTATGDATVNAFNNTIGPPDLNVGNPGMVGQNSVQYGSAPPLDGTTGTISGNTVIGAPFGDPSDVSTGVILYNAGGVTVSGNTITGSAASGSADVGVYVAGTSTDSTISGNHIVYFPPPPGYDDSNATGVLVVPEAQAATTLTANTFAGWKNNLDGTTQPPFITSASALPAATAGQHYSATLQATSAEHNPRLTWSVTGGKLPPGLTLTSGGAFTGQPTTAGTYEFTAQVQQTATATFTPVSASPVLLAARAADATLTSAKEFTITVQSAAAKPPSGPEPPSGRRPPFVAVTG